MNAMLLLSALLVQDSYLPLKEGDRVTYVVQDVGAEATPPAEVVAQARESSEGWTQVSNYLGYSACWLRSTDAGVDLKLDAKEGAAVITILKASAKTGETWTGSLGKETLTFTLRGEEPVEQGETRVKALHVEFTAAADKHAGHQPTKGDVWFAPGIGIVRAQVTTDLDCHTSTTKVYSLKP
jgi:predicted RNA-binding protein with TRAM domain